MLDNKVIQEIITTENTYNQSLALLERGFNHEARMQNSPVLKKFQPLIPQLKTISDNVLINIQDSASKNISEQQLTVLRVQRTQLLSAFFIAYQSYTAIYNDFSKEMISNPDQFTELENFVRTESGKPSQLSDYLIQPFQRGPRYSMLVDAALKNNHNLEEAQLEQLNLLAAQIKECLLAANAYIPAGTPGYQFGDISRSAISSLSNSVSGLTSSFSRLWKKAPAPQEISEETIVNSNSNS